MKEVTKDGAPPAWQTLIGKAKRPPDSTRIDDAGIVFHSPSERKEFWETSQDSHLRIDNRPIVVTVLRECHANGAAWARRPARPVRC